MCKLPVGPVVGAAVCARKIKKDNDRSLNLYIFVYTFEVIDMEELSGTAKFGQ